MTITAPKIIRRIWTWCGMDDNRHEPYCPFYVKEKPGKLNCEGGTIKFPDGEARREIVYKFCASSESYTNCTICQMLMNYYNRKE